MLNRNNVGPVIDIHNGFYLIALMGAIGVATRGYRRSVLVDAVPNLDVAIMSTFGRKAFGAAKRSRW